MNTNTHVPVIDASGQPLAPCHPARARKLLRNGRAVPHHRHDIFGIRLVDKTVPPDQIHRATLAINPGAEHTGLALMRQSDTGYRKVLLTLQIDHRGKQVKHRMEQRRNYRKARRSRLRHREPRFLNRKRPDGWLPPSVKSRLANTITWITRLQELVAVDVVVVETMQFDIQRLANPDIRGVEYQQGPLYQNTLRGFVYHRDGGKCQYCGKRPGKDNPLTLDHIVPRAAGGTDRPDNITTACRRCNIAKGDQPVEQFLSRRPAVLARIRAQLKKPLASATHLNVIIPSLLRHLKGEGHAVREWDAAATAANRKLHRIDKSHTNDAALLGYCTAVTNLPAPLVFKATGHGRRQRMTPDKYGTPRGKAWPQHCRNRDLGRPVASPPPGHKQRQTRFPDAGGISTGDKVRIRNRKGTHTGYAMLYGQGRRIALQGKKPAITGKVSTAELISRCHGYTLQTAPAAI